MDLHKSQQLVNIAHGELQHIQRDDDKLDIYIEKNEVELE